MSQDIHMRQSASFFCVHMFVVKLVYGESTNLLLTPVLATKYNSMILGPIEYNRLFMHEFFYRELSVESMWKN